ncbi:MAG TPA: ATP-binding protein [Gemmataceae bacterium]|nr:ATP-binding protein [Gemmataceae bacterium]
MGLTQVFMNLLTNAAKYSEKGSRVHLHAERQGSDVLVAVKDAGIGIPATNLRTIFEMFSQVEGALSRSQGGLGIGLCLTKQLVEMHGGTIEAKSEGPGKGSEFVVRLPIVVERTYSRETGDDNGNATPRRVPHGLTHSRETCVTDRLQEDLFLPVRAWARAAMLDCGTEVIVGNS